MPQNDEKDPKAGADDAKVDRILSGMKGARMPDILKVQSAESKGEKFAAYQSSHAVKPGDDTQKSQPAVVVDQTQQDGISAAEIAEIKKERRERGRRDATTAVIELDRIPKKKNTLGLWVFLVFLALAAVGLFINANHKSNEDDDVIAPATAAHVTDTAAATIPPPPSVVAPPTTTITSANLPNNSNSSPNTADLSAQPSASGAHSSGHASPATSGSSDPDRLLFKPHRTP